MVSSDAHFGRRGKVLVIQPNRCLSWQHTKWVFLFLTLCLAAVGGYFYSLGAWLIFPFTGLEALVIGLGLYLQCCHAHQRQIIHIDEATVSVSNGRRDARPVCFPKAWSKIVKTSDPRGWYPSRLFIAAHGEFIEIGGFLVDSEREALAANLHCAIQGT